MVGCQTFSNPLLYTSAKVDMFVKIFKRAILECIIIESRSQILFLPGTRLHHMARDRP